MGSSTNSAGKTFHFYRTSFGHDGETHPVVIASTSQDDPLVLLGKSQTGRDDIMVVLSNKEDLTTATSVKVGWTHGDHVHRSVCERLAIGG